MGASVGRALAVITCGVALEAAATEQAGTVAGTGAGAVEPLRRPTQLTFPERFSRAGEAYFSPDLRWVIFQATPWADALVDGKRVPASGHYEMYAAEVVWAGREASDGPLAELGQVIRLSPGGPTGSGQSLVGLGSANTCGWFHPTRAGVVLFGSTRVPPGSEERPGYQRAGSRYQWSFPVEMEIVTDRIDRMVELLDDTSRVPVVGEIVREHEPRVRPVFERPGYDAEASWSPDGRYILYTHADGPEGARPLDADLWLYDTRTREHTALVTADGYDGGAFFSPGFEAGGRDTAICYRSDRKRNNLLQVFTARLRFEADGRCVGMADEVQVTDDEHVNWAPWFVEPGVVMFTTSRLGHDNYELFAVSTGANLGLGAGPGAGGERPMVQVTGSAGFDGLGVTAGGPGGKYLLWTSQRGEGGSSQLWLAELDAGAMRAGLEAAGRSVPGGRPAVDLDAP